MSNRYTLERRRRMRRLAPFAALVAAFAWSAVAGADAVVRQLSGQVEIGRGEPPVWAPLAVGARVAAHERVRTGPDGRVELALDAATLRVHENSLLTLPEPEPARDRVELEAGHSLFDVIRREGRAFEVRTPTVVVSVKGTRFGVEAGADAGVVSVFRGVVGVRDAQAAEAIETLVREGFLATAGGGLPIELDVAPEGDPWSDWQEIPADAPHAARPARGSEVDRARASVHKAVDGDVVKRAAARKPELAERLRERAVQAVLEAKDEARDGAGSDASVPASPAVLDGVERVVDDTQKQLLDSTRAEEALDAFLGSIDTEGMTGGLSFPNGETELTAESLRGLPATAIVQLVDVLDAMQATYDASPSTGTPSTFADDLQSGLVESGLDQDSAQRVIERLLGPIVP